MQRNKKAQLSLPWIHLFCENTCPHPLRCLLLFCHYENCQNALWYKELWRHKQLQMWIDYLMRRPVKFTIAIKLFNEIKIEIVKELLRWYELYCLLFYDTNACRTTLYNCRIFGIDSQQVRIVNLRSAHSSHMDWKNWKNRNFEQTGKVPEFYPKCWKSFIFIFFLGFFNWSVFVK